MTDIRRSNFPDSVCVGLAWAVTLAAKTDAPVLPLLRHGADPNLQAIGFARQFLEPSWGNEAAIDAIRKYGGE